MVKALGKTGSKPPVTGDYGDGMAAPVKRDITTAGALPGANCTLSYPRNATQTYAYRVRVGRVTHGIQLIADEAQGRLRRSFYPHRLTNAQFSLGLILDGTRKYVPGQRTNAVPNEYEKFMSWLFDYMNFMLQQDEDIEGELPRMTVSVPKYDFFREGIPLGPVLFGDHVGSMLWTPTIVFETTRDYLEPHNVESSRFLGGLTDLDKNAQYFYPTGPQLAGNEAPLIFDQGVGGYDPGTAAGGTNPASADQVAAATNGDVEID